MPHIPLPPLKPGMQALALYRPDIYTHLSSLADTLLHIKHPESTLSLGEREILGAYVSQLDACTYCTAAHRGVASAHEPGIEGVLDRDHSRKESKEHENKTDGKLNALKEIAAQVVKGGKNVTTEAVEHAKKAGATDMDIPDTVLIASMFCMFNRYVNRLGTEMPVGSGAAKVFEERGRVIAERGYVGMMRPSGEKKDIEEKET